MRNSNIKFKAWHIAEQVMCDVTILTDNGAFLVGAKKGEDSISNNGRCVFIAPEEGRFCPNADFVLLQYTWLNDKNGKEIYTDHLLSNGEKIFRVYQSFGGFVIKAYAWMGDTTDLVQSDQLITESLSDAQTMGWISDGYEIIGDAYQNPELIKAIK